MTISKKAVLAAMAVVGLSLSGCASGAKGIAPVSISASEYSALGCAAARSQRDTANTRVNALSQKQNNAAVLDAAGVFLFLVPAGSLFGQNVEGELAQAKGEALALQRRADQACAAEAG